MRNHICCWYRDRLPSGIFLKRSLQNISYISRSPRSRKDHGKRIVRKGLAEKRYQVIFLGCYQFPGFDPQVRLL